MAQPTAQDFGPAQARPGRCWARVSTARLLGCAWAYGLTWWADPTQHELQGDEIDLFSITGGIPTKFLHFKGSRNESVTRNNLRITLVTSPATVGLRSLPDGAPDGDERVNL
uniref:Uncharacterized protein n=1 Tax=Oryza rufipogon TaxID=4529 RepID=A0A0E0P8G3_ORYRU